MAASYILGGETWVPETPLSKNQLKIVDYLMKTGSPIADPIIQQYNRQHFLPVAIAPAISLPTTLPTVPVPVVVPTITSVPIADNSKTGISEAVIAPPTLAAQEVQVVGPTEAIILGLAASAYPNLLHNYASYTYSLTLSALTKEDYNTMITNPESGFKPTHVMIASAGRWDGTTQKDPRFNVDFFFDKLDFETVIGMTTQSRNSNALSSEFTIIEPYGMTLLNRLIDMSNDINKENKGNYIQLPYMLQIDFFGYDNDGKAIQVPNTSKFIPIQIVGIKFKIGTKGTEYNISAVPYNHQAFSESMGSTPIKLEVAAHTIADFFLSDTKVPVVQYDTNAQTQTKTVAISTPNKLLQTKINRTTPTTTNVKGSTIGTNGTRIDSKTKIDQKLKSQNQVQYVYQNLDVLKNVKSYTGAVNAWYHQQVLNKKVEVADEILFAIDPDIAAATFPSKEVISKANRAMNKDADSSQDSLYSNLDDKSSPVGLITINQGTSITDVISLAIRNSSFITSQFLDPTKGEVTASKMDEFLSKPLTWFHITPTVEILGFDKITNRYAKKVTYHIDKKIIPQTKNPEAPLGGPNVICKDYQYIYTGKNQDILNFDLNFDTQFYVVNPANAANADITAQNNAQTPSESIDIDDGNRVLTSQEIQERIDKRVAGINELKPRKIQVASISGIGNPDGSKAEQAQQLEKNILSTPGGDMVQVTLKIIGDPDFIKQDDVFYGRNNVGTDTRKTPNGSLITDAADLYVGLTFKTPVDYDKFGLASPASQEDRYSSSLFSGIYRVITVKNHFSGGKFEQELNLIRYSMQVAPGLLAPVTDDNENKQREDSISKPQIIAVPPDNVIIKTPTIPSIDVATKTETGVIAAVNSQGITTTSTLLIANQPFIEGQPLSQIQMDTIDYLLLSGNTFPPAVMRQYNKQKEVIFNT